MGESNTVVPIRCIGTYNSIALAHRYSNSPTVHLAMQVFSLIYTCHSILHNAGCQFPFFFHNIFKSPFFFFKIVKTWYCVVVLRNIAYNSRKCWIFCTSFTSFLTQKSFDLLCKSLIDGRMLCCLVK